MRLIDADSLKETLDYYISEAGWSEEIKMALRWVKDEFIDAETTIEAIPIDWIMEHAEETESIGLPNMAEAFRAMVKVWRDKNDTDRMDSQP